MTALSRYAYAVDVNSHGIYRVNKSPHDPHPLPRFNGRVTADGSSGYRAEPGRYHLYAGWFCPWAHQVAITLRLAGLSEVVSVSYVDNERDGRGWAFGEAHGPDVVNGFRFLRQAYEATEPGFDGHVSVPTLWDRTTGRVVSNSYRAIGIDLATQFTRWARDGIDTYPARHRVEIERLGRRYGPAVHRGIGSVAGQVPGADPKAVGVRSRQALADLDHRLTGARYLVGRRLTQADIRLWVALVRYPDGLRDFPHLWTYARDLLRIPAFRETTDFASFGRADAEPEWTSLPAEAPDPADVTDEPADVTG